MVNSSQNTLTSKRNTDFDILRIVAILAVIFLHEAAEGWHQTTPTHGWEVRNAYDAAVRWGVPVFVMISGALFLDVNKSVSISKLYMKNLLRIVLAYFFWAALYQLYNAITHGFSFGGFVGGVFKGCFHLWFMKMLMGLYIAIPILKAVTSDKKTEQYFIVVALITTFIIPQLIPLTSHIGAHLPGVLQKFYDIMSVKIAAGFTGYFVLGHYLSNYPLGKKHKTMVILAAILSYIYVVAMTSYRFHATGTPSGNLYNNLNIFTFLEAVAIFSAAKGLGESRFAIKNKPLILRLSKWSFGVYLVHVLVLRVLRDYAGISTFSFNTAVSVPVMTLLIFLLSNLTVWLLDTILPKAVKNKIM